MTKPLYFWNGSSFELVGPTTPQSPFAYQTSAPTAPATGDIWIDSDGDVDTYNRQLTRYYFVASAGQTSVSGTDANGLTLAYVAGSEAVYVNGALQVRGVDYTATNGTSITGLSALALNDVVEVFAYTAFTVANAYTKSESDNLFATKTNFPADAWISWTPSWTNLTIGNATVDAKYKQLGKTVFFELRVIYGSTTSISGVPYFTLPVNGRMSQNGKITGFFEDVGSNAYAIFPNTTSNIVNLYCIRVDGTYAGLGATSSTVPFTWTTNDIIALSGFYEAA